ncbi:hypothetical protein [Aquabacterium sp. J223]|uniref:hypothetical protein n=1 Tax=Aquabacterium sp. J223 TaxID=2898431 RepID=UPI0021ADED83|nr:hypothetical protein [Aquabacterium sp. J223]UUX94765.1 hypothetical protein LRS07_15970 [Aquabacterium sp. J223]
MLQLDPQWPPLDPLEVLTGWRREFCVELLGEGKARLFVRAVGGPSFKAQELKRGLLFHRLGANFQDLPGCVASLEPDLEALAASAKRVPPTRDNLFSVVTFDREAWERVVRGLERWQRR